MTAYGTVESAVEAMKQGAYDYLPKPIDMKRLRALVQKALEFQAVVAENNELRLRLQTRSESGLLVGESESMRAVARLIEEVASSDVTVLIEGESGTGKEIVARSIHVQSARRDRPFISVNCAALAEQLLEAELFGHVKGAFTGAIANKPGRFQLADGGTLFLDEIGDLSPKGQGDLLRVLEDGTFRMVGRLGVDPRQCASDCGYEQEAARGGGGGQIPRGPFLPLADRADCHAAVAGAGGGYSAADRAVLRAVHDEAQAAAQANVRRGAAALPALSVAGQCAAAAQRRRTPGHYLPRGGGGGQATCRISCASTTATPPRSPCGRARRWRRWRSC